MPTRQPPFTPPLLPSPPSNTSGRPHHRISPLFLPLTASLSCLLILLLLFLLIYRRLSRPRTAPSPLVLPSHHQPHPYPYSLLRRSTSSFSPSLKLGQGGFGSVFRAELPPSSLPVAVKLMDSGSLQGEREFHNELSLAPLINASDRIVSLLGFCSNPRRRRLLLVYEFMPNGSLQDALLDRKAPELMAWARRLSIAIDIARGLEFLHNSCVPAVIHGDIKASNILLDCNFNAKIADFGLARLKTDCCLVEMEAVDGAAAEKKEKDKEKEKKKKQEECETGSAIEETESIDAVATEAAAMANGSIVVGFGAVEVSPEASPEMVFGTDAASNSEILDKTSISEGCFDKASVDSCGKEMAGGGRSARKKGNSGKDWWWKQDNAGSCSDSGRVKDYVMEWIGTEIKKERPKGDWLAASLNEDGPKLAVKAERKKQQRRMEWWASLDEEREKKKEKSRPAREWWREEFCEELCKKKKKKRISELNCDGVEQWWQHQDDEMDPPAKKKKKNNRSRSSRSSMDWWMEGLSGEFRFGGRRSSLDWMSGEIPKSGGVSSTPSMRGTVCYVAPEYGGGGPLSEKCDVYSYGVLLLVLVSGRRPLRVTASPLSEFERANLISWARQLARSGNLLDLVDPAIENLDREQALLCITIALLCLQRSPLHRPNIKEVVGMLSGESEAPNLPMEFSPSPPSAFPFKSRKKAR